LLQTETCINIAYSTILDCYIHILLIRSIFILSILLLSFSTKSQSLADSLILRYENSPDTVRVKKYIEIAGQIQNKDYANCIRLCDEVLRLTQGKNVVNRADAFFLKGLTSYFAGEHEKTLQYYVAAIKAFEDCQYLPGKAKVLNELGIFYRRQKNSRDAERNFKEAYIIAHQEQEYAIMATALNNQGLLAQDNKEHTKALDYFAKARSIYEKVKDSIGISYTMDYSSTSFLEQGLYSKSHKYQTQAYDIRITFKDSNAAALSLMSLSELESIQDHYPEAERYLLRCLEISQKIKYKDLTALCYKLLATNSGVQGDHEKAYRYHVNYSQLNEEIFNEKRSRQIGELQTRYESEKKGQEIAALTRENELSETRRRNQRNLLLACIGLILLSGVAYYNYSKRKKQKEIDATIIHEQEQRNHAILDAEEKERIRIARDLHDGVAQMIVAAKMQLESFMDRQNSKSEEQASLQHAFDLVTEASIEVRAISHSMVPNALLKSGLVAAIRDFVNRTSNERLMINLQVLGLDGRLSETVETVIFRVLQELVNNILKHAAASEVVIQLIRENDELTLIVEDNGVGFDSSKLTEKAGMGLRNIESRVQFLHGQVHFDSTIGKGTTVIIEIPL